MSRCLIKHMQQFYTYKCWCVVLNSEVISYNSVSLTWPEFNGNLWLSCKEGGRVCVSRAEVELLPSHITSLVTRAQKRLYFLKNLWPESCSTIWPSEEQQRASWLEASQPGVTPARPRTWKALQHLEHHWNPSTRASATSVKWDIHTEAKDAKTQLPPQPQSVQPAAIWQKIQRCPLPNHQTAEQLHSWTHPQCFIFQNRWSTKDSHIVLFF